MARSKKKKIKDEPVSIRDEIARSDMQVFKEQRDIEVLRGEMDVERSSFRKHWDDLGRFIAPRRTRFFITDVNKGDPRNKDIIDSTATMAKRTLQSGMMAGVTSPSRPWFKLGLAGLKEDEQTEAVKTWLSLVTRRMSSVFLKSNLYNVLPTLYGDIGTFGTACIFQEEDFEEVTRFYSFPIGSFMVANDEKLRVRVFLREFEMTVRQIVEEFGRVKENPKEIDWSNVSESVKSMWNSNAKEKRIGVVHIIRPNPDYDPNKLESKYKKFSSIYYERGAAGFASNTRAPNALGATGKFLRKKGYDYYPAMAPRWETTGEDVYATSCPGMIALGDIKQLQYGEKKTAQAIEKMINPPMVGPTSLQQQNVTILPGDITYVDGAEANRGFRAAHEVNFNIQPMEMKQEQIRMRIKRAFFEDLFLMIASSDRRQITAREIDERHEEKLLALGPVLEQLNQDLLDPLIDNTFTIMQRQGLIPEAPPEIQGQDLKIEYISIMAQAQKLADIGKIERLTNFAGQLAQFKPEVLDKIDGDKAIDIYGEMTGVPVELVKTDEEVSKQRQQRAAAQQAQQKQEQMQQMASMAKDVSGVDTSEGNALSDLLKNSGG